jgi:flagellar biosynthesis/type III secretory pathway protein FliH
MTDAVEELIGEVARKHGIAIGRDDPILVLHTMNDRLVRESAAAQQVLLDAYQQELEVLASRWSMEATDRADRILQAALAGSQEAMASAMREGASATGASVRTEVERALAQIAGRLQDARRTALLNLAAACITLAAAGIVVWATVASH